MMRLQGCSGCLQAPQGDFEHPLLASRRPLAMALGSAVWATPAGAGRGSVSLPSSPPSESESDQTRQAVSAPLPSGVFTITPQDPPLEAAGFGVACALGDLVRGFCNPGWLPALVDERLVPLCGLFARVPSSLFSTESHDDLEPARLSEVRPSPGQNTQAHAIPAPPPPASAQSTRLPMPSLRDADAPAVRDVSGETP